MSEFGFQQVKSTEPLTGQIKERQSVLAFFQAQSSGRDALLIFITKVLRSMKAAQGQLPRSRWAGWSAFYGE